MGAEQSRGGPAVANACPSGACDSKLILNTILRVRLLNFNLPSNQEHLVVQYKV